MKSNCPASELERVDHTEKLNWESRAWELGRVEARPLPARSSTALRGATLLASRNVPTNTSTPFLPLTLMNPFLKI